MSSLSLVGAFLRRDWATARSYRFAFPLQIVEAVFQLALFFYLGKIVDSSSLGESADVGPEYFSFVIPGLALVELMNVGVAAFTDKLRRDQMTGTLEALLLAPAPHRVILFGSAASDMLRAAALGVVMLVLAVTIFGVHFDIDATSILLLLIAVPASMLFFVAVGLALAAATIVFKETAVLVSFTSTIFALLSGVYFPTEVLPGFLEAIADAIPVTWALDVLRAALFGGSAPWGKLALLVGAAIVTVPLALMLFRFAFDRARRAGSLAQY